jgi:hypothetical protein
MWRCGSFALSVQCGKERVDDGNSGVTRYASSRMNRVSGEWSSSVWASSSLNLARRRYRITHLFQAKLLFLGLLARCTHQGSMDKQRAWHNAELQFPIVAGYLCDPSSINGWNHRISCSNIG